MLSLLSGLALLAISFLLLKLGTFCWDRNRLPPGPFPFPILGNLWQLRFQLHPETLLQNIWLALSDNYDPQASLWVSPIPIVVLSGFQAVKEALVSNSEQFSGRPLTSLFQDLFGEQGRAAPPAGEEDRRHMWWQQRRFCLVTLQGLGLGKLALEVQLQKQAAELVEAFRQELSRSFDPQVSIVRSTVRVIGALVFGHHFLSEDPIFQELTQAIDFGLALTQGLAPEEALGGPLSPQLHDVFSRALCHLPGPHWEIFRYQGVVRSFTRREITGRKLKAPEALKDFINCSLAQISKAMDEPVSTFHEENLVQVVIDLFLGGTNTTATTQRWALVYMIQHGAVQGEGPINLLLICPDLRFPPPHMFYENATLGQNQEFCSQPSGLYRGSWFNFVVFGFSLPNPKGTIILPLCRGSVLYDPECWETPPQFNPGHFLDKDGNFVANEAFLPFSAGHCVCPGDQLARMELFLMFATLLRTFRFQLPEGSPGLKLEYIFGGTLQPQPQEICAVPRLNSP
ncbi:hypothetical protein EGK_11847, partial [Macaca mulatta]